MQLTIPWPLYMRGNRRANREYDRLRDAELETHHRQSEMCKSGRHRMTEDNVRMEGDRRRCRACVRERLYG